MVIATSKVKTSHKSTYNVGSDARDGGVSLAVGIAVARGEGNLLAQDGDDTALGSGRGRALSAGSEGHGSGASDESEDSDELHCGWWWGVVWC